MYKLNVKVLYCPKCKVYYITANPRHKCHPSARSRGSWTITFPSVNDYKAAAVKLTGVIHLTGFTVKPKDVEKKIKAMLKQLSINGRLQKATF